MANQLIEDLEQRLRKMDPRARQRLIMRAYGQLIPNQKGKQAKGRYRDLIERGNEDPLEFLDQFSHLLEKYDLEDHAGRLRDYYSLKDSQLTTGE